MIAAEAGCYLLLIGRVWKQVARDLFGCELIERHVLIKCPNDPVAPGPHVSMKIFVIAMRICIPSSI